MSIPPIRIPITATDGFSANLGKLNMKLDGIEKQFRGLKSLKNIGTALGLFELGKIGIQAGKGLFDVFKSSAEAGDDLLKLSSRLGLSVESLQKWQYAAKMSDIDAETFQKSMFFMGRAASSAGSGIKAQADLFKALGVQVKDSHGNMRDMESILNDVVKQMQLLPDPLTRNRVAVALFGKAGGQMVDMISKGPEELAKMRTEAEKLGIMTTANAEAGEKFSDSFKKVTAVFENMKNIVGLELMPQITKLTQTIAIGLISHKDEIRAWAAAFADKLPAIIEGTIALVKGLSAVLIPLISFVGKLVLAIGPGKVAILGLALMLGIKLVGAIKAVQAALMVLNAASVASPLGLAVAGMLAFGVAIAAVVMHFKNLNDENQRLASARNDWGYGKVSMQTTDEALTGKYRRLSELYRRSQGIGLGTGESFTDADLAEQRRIEQDLQKQGAPIDSGAGQDAHLKNMKYVFDTYGERAGVNKFGEGLASKKGPSPSQHKLVIENRTGLKASLIPEVYSPEFDASLSGPNFMGAE